MLNPIRQYPLLLIMIVAGLILVSGRVSAAEIRVAVASNFAGVAKRVAMQFEAETGHEVILSAGSSGKHYAQIINGAPFDLFLAADTIRPERLEAGGYAIAGSRFTYAIGELVLWSASPGMEMADGRVLLTGNFRFLAMANPDLAPYGRAARETLLALGAWEKLRTRIVTGENINQAFHFVHSGNADLGLIARSQLVTLEDSRPGVSWAVPLEYYSPIEQQAVLLKDSKTAREFMDFLRSDGVSKVIMQYGYRSP